MKLDNPRKWRQAVLASYCMAAITMTSAMPAFAADDELVVALSSFAEQTMTPWSGSGQRKTYLDLIYDYLTYIDPKTQKPIPGLATPGKRVLMPKRGHSICAKE